MPYDDGLLQRCVDALHALHATGVRQKNVFGMRGFLIGSRMFAAVGEESIIVKFIPAEYAAGCSRPGAKPFAPGGSKLGTWIEFDADAVADDPELRDCLDSGLRALRES